MEDAIRNDPYAAAAPASHWGRHLLPSEPEAPIALPSTAVPENVNVNAAAVAVLGSPYSLWRNPFTPSYATERDDLDWLTLLRVRRLIQDRSDLCRRHPPRLALRRPRLLMTVCAAGPFVRSRLGTVRASRASL